MTYLLQRLAGAPISWGVCEVPGWGLMLPPETVLSEMTALGLAATELGPVGYLGREPDDVRRKLDSFGLQAVGGFVPLVLHDPGRRRQALDSAERACRLLQAAGASCFVTAAVTDDDWSPRAPLDERGWEGLSETLDMVDRACEAHGLRQVLHPHAGTLVETAADVAQVLARSSVKVCLDTGHLAIGGVEPAAFARDHAARVGLVHLKDARHRLVAEVRSGRMTLREATRAGLFCPLGDGDLPLAPVIAALEASSYRGWYVIEQDIVLDEGIDSGPGGPAAAVQASIGFLEALSAHAGPPR